MDLHTFVGCEGLSGIISRSWWLGVRGPRRRVEKIIVVNNQVFNQADTVAISAISRCSTSCC